MIQLAAAAAIVGCVGRRRGAHRRCLAARHVDVDDIGAEALDVLRILQVDHVGALVAGDAGHLAVVQVD